MVIVKYKHEVLDPMNLFNCKKLSFFTERSPEESKNTIVVLILCIQPKGFPFLLFRLRICIKHFPLVFLAVNEREKYLDYTVCTVQFFVQWEREKTRQKTIKRQYYIQYCSNILQVTGEGGRGGLYLFIFISGVYTV